MIHLFKKKKKKKNPCC